MLLDDGINRHISWLTRMVAILSIGCEVLKYIGRDMKNIGVSVIGKTLR